MEEGIGIRADAAKRLCTIGARKIAPRFELSLRPSAYLVDRIRHRGFGKEVYVFSIRREAVPVDSLLRMYRGGFHPERWTTYLDCFCVGVPYDVNLADFVLAFYTSPLFRIERWILRVTIGAASTDGDARAVALGTGKTFAAWYVGQRTATQLLMCDRYEATRSWFQVTPLECGGTLLQFGSGVATRRKGKHGAPTLGGGFRFLVGFHVLYSRLLLWQASRRVGRKR